MSAIIPNKEERSKFEQAYTLFLKKLNAQLKGAQAILGGSSAKDTWLPQSHDIDVFVAYDHKKYAEKSSQLSGLLEPILEKLFPKLERVNGSRDYFQIPFQDYIFEVVPILKIEKAEQAVNLTDVSPLHTKWVNGKGKKLKNEIRKAKAFFKAHRLYGAESYINGFSGYVLEILVINYGSFDKLLQAALKWSEKTVIDYENYYQKGMVFYEINKSKLLSPLIVVDPVDKARNAAAALSLEKFQTLKKVARAYLKDPSEDYFQQEQISLAQVKKLAKRLPFVYLEITPLKGKRDVVGAKLLKAFNFLQQELASFQLQQAAWDYSPQTIFYFILTKKELPPVEVRSGPPLKLKNFVADFKKKNKETFSQDGRIYARLKVVHPQLADFLQFTLKKRYFKEKVASVVSKVVV